MEHYTTSETQRPSCAHIIDVLQRYGIKTLTQEDLEKLPVDSWQHIVVWYIKEAQLDVEEIGVECFGNEWEAEKWI